MGDLYKRSFPVSDKLSVMVPTVGDILDNEDDYYPTICAIVATPYDMMVQLDDANIDFTKINDFDLFCLMFQKLQETDTRMIFGDVDLKKFKAAINQNTGEIVLVDEEEDIVIDRVVHAKICGVIRNMFHMERNDKKPANEEAKAYLLKRARQQQKRRQNKKQPSLLENYIVALVNTEQFKYNYETVRDITILQFYASLTQIVHKIRYDNTMIGYYAGTVKGDDLTQADRSWIDLE